MNLVRGGASSSPASLFAASEPGVWYDPSDLSTLFQDSAGTTPVTAPAQTVGLILDKSGRGNNATQATSAQRPTYGINPITGTRNLLLATNTLATQSVTVIAVAQTLSFTGTGTVTLTGASTAGPLVGTGANNRVSLTFTPTAGSLTLTVSGSVTLAQLERGSTATAYQNVVTQYEVTEAGVASVSYLAFDGVDDGMVTNTITPSINKVQAFGGLRKLSDAASAIFVEFSANVNSNSGSFLITSPNNTAGRFTFLSRGSILPVNAAASVAMLAPTTRTITGLGDISADNMTLNINGSQVSTVSDDQGTGNYLAYPLYIGRRGGTTLPLNGRIYSLIVRFGPNLTTGQTTSTESWVNSKTGAY